MNCYILTRDFACPTSSAVTWSLEKNGRPVKSDAGIWRPEDDLMYEIGGNTWDAAGCITESSKAKLSNFWAVIRGATNSLENTHVLGDYTRQIAPRVIVSQRFVYDVNALDESLFDFTPHENVWDAEHDSAPWDGPFYLATLLPLIKSYDLNRSDITPFTQASERYSGAYSSAGVRRTVRATEVAGKLIWRDAYTRDVLCKEEFLTTLRSLGVFEWQAIKVDVFDDRH